LLLCRARRPHGPSGSTNVRHVERGRPQLAVCSLTQAEAFSVLDDLHPRLAKSVSRSTSRRPATCRGWIARVSWSQRCVAGLSRIWKPEPPRPLGELGTSRQPIAGENAYHGSPPRSRRHALARRVLRAGRSPRHRGGDHRASAHSKWLLGRNCPLRCPRTEIHGGRHGVQGCAFLSS
jgi:hypothetical protein